MSGPILGLFPLMRKRYKSIKDFYFADTRYNICECLRVMSDLLT